jgi:hypothetical protein
MLICISGATNRWRIGDIHGNEGYSNFERLQSTGKAPSGGAFPFLGPYLVGCRRGVAASSRCGPERWSRSRIKKSPTPEGWGSTTRQLLRFYRSQNAFKRVTRRGSGWCEVPGRVACTTGETASYFHSFDRPLWITSGVMRAQALL